MQKTLSPDLREVIALAQSLITIPSVSDDKKECDRILDFAATYISGYSVRKFEENGVRSLIFSNQSTVPDHFKIILNAHLDVVPARSSQFKPFIKNGRLYGRGALDMKSAAAAMIILFKKVSKDIPYPIGLQLVTDEETGGRHGVTLQLKKNVTADFVIAGEPTDLHINTESKGVMWFDVSATGTSAHGAFPWKGDNAVERINRFIHDVKESYPTPTREVWRTTANVSRFSSTNTALNKVPEQATATIDIRFVPRDIQRVRKLVNTLSRKHGVTIHFHVNDSHQFVSPEVPAVNKLSTIIKSVTGRKPRFLKQHYGSDMRMYTAAGIDAVCFGPGGGGMHEDTEFVNLTSVRDFYTILKDFLASI